MIIVSVLYNRPDYTRLSLQHLAAVRGIEKVTVFFQIDPWNNDVIKQAYEWTASPSSILINKERLGCNRNIFKGLERAFQEDDTVGVIEDDVLVSKDWLEFVQRPEFADATAVCTFRKHFEPIVNPDWQGYETTTNFCPWGWVTWRKTWEKIKQHWSDDDVVSWDTAVHRSGVMSDVIFPLVSRTFNCGVIGTYCTSEEEYMRDNFSPYWAGKCK